MSKAEELIACLEGEIAKRDEELAACHVAVENCELFRVRIAELEARIVWLECEAQVNAAPVSEVKEHGVVMPETEDFCFCGKHVSLQMISGGASKHGYLGSVTLLIDGKYIEYTRLNAASVQQVSVPDGWNDGYRSAMNSAASGARQLYVQHCHHHGVNGLLDRCKELEQSFIRDADALLTAALSAGKDSVS